MAASPLLYNVVFNATKEINLPSTGADEEPVSVYHNWMLSMPVLRNASTLVVAPNVLDNLISLNVEAPFKNRFYYQKLDHIYPRHEVKPGTILKMYLESAVQQIRPHVRPLDMYGSYAPFITMAGIPALDMSFVNLTTGPKIDEEDDEPPNSFNQRQYPLRHTQYDNENIMFEQIDPGFVYHGLIAQLLAKIIQDLAESLFLPFNLFDYAQLLKDFNFKSQHLHSLIVDNARDFISAENHQNVELTKLNMSMYGKKFCNSKFEFCVFLVYLESAITNFTNEVFRFHARQDYINLKMYVFRVSNSFMLIIDILFYA